MLVAASKARSSLGNLANTRAAEETNLEREKEREGERERERERKRERECKYYISNKNACIYTKYYSN